jgi:excisionase family DNA binding protein
MPDKMLAAKDAAEMLGVCTDTLYRQWRAWDLKAYRIGSGLKFKSSDIDTWIERRAA